MRITVMLKKKTSEKKKKTSKYHHFPVANFQLLQNLTKEITYHRGTACCFSVAHSVTDTMLELDLKQVPELHQY